MTAHTINTGTWASIKKLALVLVCVAATFALPGDADAASTEVRHCTTSGTMTFSPPLKLVATSGTINYSYTAHCVVAYSNGGTGVQTYNWSAPYNYTGSCVTASVVNPIDPITTGVLVGGTSLSRLRVDLPGGPTWTGEYVLESANGDPCDMTTAAVVSASVALIPGSIP